MCLATKISQLQSLISATISLETLDLMISNMVAKLFSAKKSRPCPKKARKTQIPVLRHIHIKHA